MVFMRTVFMISITFLLASSTMAQKKSQFLVELIPERKAESLLGTTLKENCPVKREDLRTVTVPYLNEKGEKKEGLLIVHKKVTDDIVFIFN